MKLSLLRLSCLLSVSILAISCSQERVSQSEVSDTSPSSEVKSESTSTSKAETKSIMDKEFTPFKIYTDENSPDNHYFPSGWMGDYSDIIFQSDHMNNPHSGTTSIKVSYSNKASQGARWAGIYWQNPANNWGNRPGGYDLTGATKLTFWARGEKGNERIEEFKMGGITGEYSDSDIAGIGPVILTKEWKKYSIDLTGKDLTSIVGGFGWSMNLDENPNGATFYLDDIRYE